MSDDGEELLPIERILQRWASSVNGGIPDQRGATDQARPPPLPSDLAMYVDRDTQRAPARVREVVTLLYRYHLPPEEVGRRMNVSRQKVYALEREALWYFRGTFSSNGVLQRFEQRVARLRRRAATMPGRVTPAAVGTDATLETPPDGTMRGDHG